MNNQTLTYDRHPQYDASVRIWELTQAASTPMAVKDAGPKYLPLAANHESKLDPRYIAYLDRAVFYGFTQETISGLLGLAFRQGVTIETDAATDYISKNIDGDGIGLEQQAKASMTDLIKYGRAGLFVDFPPTDGEVSKAEQERLALSATVNLYDAFSIVDWSSVHVGSVSMLSRVVLCEIQYRDSEAGTTEEVEVKRTLALDKEGYYFVTEEVEGADDRIYQPTNSAGQRLNYIPFYFVGSTNNNTNIDDAPIYPIADLNIAHYKNSADYETAAFLVSQPQPWATGLTQSWVDQNISGFLMGSGLLALPQGATFGIEQTQPNMVAMEAMNHKQQSMISLGAKLISPDMSFNTASEAIIASASENSRLQTLMDNVVMAYDSAMAALADFNGSTQPVFTIDTDLSAIMADPQMVASVTDSWMKGLTPARDARDYQRSVGVLKRTEEEIEDDLADTISPLESTNAE